MLALAGIVMGVLLGALSGGSWRMLGRAHLRMELVALPLFLVQAFARGVAIRFVGSLAIFVWGVCSLALLLVLFADCRKPGIGIALAGTALNAVVVVANAGMPVVIPSGLEARAFAAVSASAGFYDIAGASTHLPFLGDVLPTNIGLASAGDVLLAVGICIFLSRVMLGESR